MKIIHFSKNAEITKNPTNDKVYLFTQFFIHRDKQRQLEITECLKRNINNPVISKIFLLNEQIYTPQEMQLNSGKIHQENIGKRLSFQDVFKFIRMNNISGYFIIANSDIFFDDTLNNLQLSTLHEKKQMFAQLRYEYDEKLGTRNSPIFGPRFDSQDTWIFHTNYTILENQEKAMNIILGQPGCDNKIIYILTILGYDIINDPLFIKTFHNHKSKLRDYTIKDVIQKPWGVVIPANANPLMIPPSLGINLLQVSQATRAFQDVRYDDNNRLFEYIESKINSGKNFIIPRVSGIENNVAVFGRMCKNLGKIPDDIQQYFQRILPAMKNNAGIKMTNFNSILKYSDMYLEAFDNCEMFAGWEVHGDYINHISQSYDYIVKTYNTKKIIWAFNFDIFHYIYSNPWTRALKGKRILIISPFEESIKEKIPIREKIYGIDLFPDCIITTIKPPQTQADQDSREFDIELTDFFKKLDKIKDTYDVALVSCGGYANPVCNYIYKSGKSSIYIGGVLQLYFGILGNRWLIERPDVIRLFLNEHWSRPKISERPINYEKVEGGCYW